MEEKLWYLKHCNLFQQLSAEDIARLEQHAKFRRFERQNVIYLPTDAGDSLVLLATGRVKLYHLTSDGKETLLAFIEPGEVFGELAVFDGGHREEFAETMEKSTAVLIPRAEMVRLMEQHADVSLGITKLLGLRRRRIERRLKSLLFRSNRERLIHLILELVEQYGQRTPEGIALKIRLSHQELASIIGATRETVTVLLGELQSEGLLLVQRRRVIVRDLQRLSGGADLTHVVSPPPPEPTSRIQQAPT